MNAYSQLCYVRCDLMALTLMHINAPNCSCGWSTSAFVGRIYVRVYARVETDCVSRSTNAFTNLFSSIIKHIFLVHHTSFVTWHHKMDGKLHLSEKPISCFILFLAMLVLKWYQICQNLQFPKMEINLIVSVKIYLFRLS